MFPELLRELKPDELETHSGFWLCHLGLSHSNLEPEAMVLMQQTYPDSLDLQQKTSYQQWVTLPRPEPEQEP
ncbi:hypothetical protein Ahy_B08g094101 isoform A [Arachis hypogaea]|uniref:Uncharacterized protein n=1 Tax=Arachis hypogaea TaxID=3818 RepID=A0A444Y841_ARAHY|nr:hypothetical protein Ahy_B08g094101 isoform A [Arachis hypogaea]